ncbi:MAG: DNA repair protein RecO [Oscillospiraceae bacterium]|nr:DNA repair protein RecO [Oscillospiraceae bacterium]
MFDTTRGLILREVRYKEADRILTVLTESNGKITAKARGALRKSSRTAAATQMLTWSELTLFGNKGKWTVNEGSVLEGFDGLRQDIERLALGSYLAECLETFAVEDEPDPALLQLGLNSLYALSNGLAAQEKIKAAFELRLMCLTGFRPELSACAVCGKGEPEDPILSPSDGTICCRSCRRASWDGVPLKDGALSAMRYIVSAPAKRLLSFAVDGPALKSLSRATELYLRAHAERSFATLAYYKQFEDLSSAGTED